MNCHDSLGLREPKIALKTFGHQGSPLCESWNDQVYATCHIKFVSRSLCIPLHHMFPKMAGTSFTFL